MHTQPYTVQQAPHQLMPWTDDNSVTGKTHHGEEIHLTVMHLKWRVPTMHRPCTDSPTGSLYWWLVIKSFMVKYTLRIRRHTHGRQEHSAGRQLTHRILDDFIVVRHFTGIHRRLEGPSHLVSLHESRSSLWLSDDGCRTMIKNNPRTPPPPGLQEEHSFGKSKSTHPELTLICSEVALHQPACPRA